MVRSAALIVACGLAGCTPQTVPAFCRAPVEPKIDIKDMMSFPASVEQLDYCLQASARQVATHGAPLHALAEGVVGQCEGGLELSVSAQIKENNLIMSPDAKAAQIEELRKWRVRETMFLLARLQTLKCPAT